MFINNPCCKIFVTGCARKVYEFFCLKHTGHTSKNVYERLASF